MSSQQHGTCAELGPDLAWLRIAIVNVYFIGAPRGDRSWVLVDAGLPLSTEKIARAAAERFGADARPAAVILTHGHFDHVGALPRLAERWQAPIYAHRLELPYLTGQSSYPAPIGVLALGLAGAITGAIATRRALRRHRR